MNNKVLAVVGLLAIIALGILAVGCEPENPYYPIDGAPSQQAQYLELNSVRIQAIELINDTNGTEISVLYFEADLDRGGVNDIRTQIKVINRFSWIDRYITWDLKLELVHDDVYRIVEMLP